MMRSILVESPFQLLQAIEYEKTTRQKYLLYVRLNELNENNSQIRKLIKYFNVENYIFLYTKKKVFALFYLVPLLLSFVYSKEVVVGDENSILFRILKHAIPKKKIVLLDDGVATILKGSGSYYKRFSIFEEYAFIPNKFDECYKLVSGIKGEEVNIIVGGKLVEEMICSSETYDIAIGAMVHNVANNGYRVIYIAHRGESEESLKRLREKFNITVIRNSMPIELVAVELNYLPRTVSSVLSTALFSMSLIYRNTIFYSYPLKPELILKRREYVEKFFSIMHQHSSFVTCNIDWSDHGLNQISC